MDLVPYAVPFFVLLIVLELGWGWYTGNNTYRINDGVNSVMLGVLSTSTKLVVLDIGARVFSTVEQDLSWWQLDVNSPMAWLWGILVFDFCYYWFHRISHERQILWASHVAHTPERRILICPRPLRQTSTAFLFSWLFYIPCFVARHAHPHVCHHCLGPPDLPVLDSHAFYSPNWAPLNGCLCLPPTTGSIMARTPAILTKITAVC